MNEEENKVVEAVEETTQQVEETIPEVDDGVIRINLDQLNQKTEDAIPEVTRLLVDNDLASAVIGEFTAADTHRPRILLSST